MSLRSPDRWILALLLPVWTAGFVLFAIELGHSRPARPSLIVEPAADAGRYPRVVRLRSVAPEESEVQVGDALVRVGDRDLRGAGAVEFLAHSLASAAPDGGFAVEIERGGELRQARAALLPRPSFRLAVLALSFAATAVFVILRAPRLRTTQTFLPAALVWSFTWLQYLGPIPEQTYLYVGLRTLAGCLWAPLILRAALCFPEEVAPRSLPWWPWWFAPLGLTWSSMWFGVPLSIELGTRLNPAIGAAVIVAVLAILTRNYLHAGALGRRQVRWVLWGIWLALLPILVTVTASALDPEFQPFWNFSLWGLLAIPLSIFMAITRSHLLDIDRLLSATASYTLLTIALVAGLLTVLPPLVLWIGERSGADPRVAQVALAVVFAPLIVAAERSLRPRLERLFFAERQALQEGVERLGREVAVAPDTESMVERTVGELCNLLRPAGCAIYGRVEDVLAPLAARGLALTPVIDAAGSFASNLARGSALDLDRGSRVLDDMDTSAEDRAALESIGTPVIVPVTRGDDLAGFIALGRKRSGDVYTPTDLALLGTLGTSMSSALVRFGEGELLAEARALQDRLRRYVPGSVADQLVEGNLRAGEYEVTVLFVDLRGYARLTQDRPPSEVFELVSRYTEVVSAAIQEHHGSVVEFNGDGMMAVFGAAGELPEREAEAVRAAREVARRVTDLELFGTRNADPVLGVGVATGPAYVGAIRSVDRFIWSAIGSTTNLAARLQELSRSLGCTVALDAATHSGAGDAARDFRRQENVPIRGFRERRDVFLLP
jgi:class 3 adenylate cyclase